MGRKRIQAPGYSAKHKRQYRDRGLPSAHLCAHCQKRQATNWATVHDRDGTSPDDYQPLCRSCHGIYDGWGAHEQAKTHCPQGHEYTEDNIRWTGPNHTHRRCKTCESAYHRARYAARRRSSSPANV